MRKIILIMFILVSLNLISEIEKFEFKAKEIELDFENVKIGKLEFIDGNSIIVDSKKLGNNEIKKDKNRLSFFSEEGNKIFLSLPVSKTYKYEFDDAVMFFDPQQVKVITGDNETIKFENGELEIYDDGENLVVKINDDGIFVNDDDEEVIIDSEGIFVKDDDDEKNIHNFWGKLLSGFIRTISGSILSVAGDSSEKIVRHIINEDSDDFDLSFDSGKFFGGNRKTKDIHKTFKEKAENGLELINKNGSVRIDSWEKDFVDIQAELTTHKDEDEFDKIEISVKGKDKKCVIESIWKSRTVQANVCYEIKVPKDMVVAIVHSSNGSIKLENIRGDSEVITSNGSIKVVDSKGNFDITSSNGKLTVKNISGSVKAKTSNSSIDIAGVSGSVSGSSSNGRITAEISELPEDANFTTSNGSIKLYLSSDIEADIIASTTNSKIKLHDIEVVTSDFSSNYLNGKIGKGGKLIKATTSNSSIDINKLEEKYISY